MSFWGTISNALKYQHFYRCLLLRDYLEIIHTDKYYGKNVEVTFLLCFLLQKYFIENSTSHTKNTLEKNMNY